jgi:ATP-dependent Clp protease adaptor protein ClpS
MESEKDTKSGGAAVVTPKKEKTDQKKKPGQMPPYHVVLLNDDDHTYEYVIEMLKVIFGHPDEMGYEMAKEVNESGKAIVFTTHKERAEFKRDLIHAYGTDTRVATCKGSMSAKIEPA